MLKQVVEILGKINRSIQEGIGYPCQVRVRWEDRGVEITVWSVMNGKQQHYCSRFFNLNEIHAGDDTLLVQFIYETCRFFKSKIAGRKEVPGLSRDQRPGTESAI